MSAIKPIYGHGTPCVKDEQYSVTAGTHFHLADVVEKQDHARKRKVLSSAYALKNLEGWEYKVADKASRLVVQLDRRCSAPPKHRNETLHLSLAEMDADLRLWTNFFTLDAIADIGLSEQLGLLDHGHDIVEGQHTNGDIVHLPLRECLYPTARKQSLIVWSYAWYKVLDKLTNVIPFYARMSRSSKGWDAIVLRRAQIRLNRYCDGEKLDDFFQALMEDKNGSPNELEWGEIVAEVNIMMNAGSVTTAIAIANCMYQLILHPQLLQQLREEIDAALDPEDVVAPYDKVKHLPFLRACLDESLRLFPPTPHGLPRETPPEGLWINDLFVPGNTTVSISAMVAHRDESAFPEAAKFKPERFLGDSGKSLQPYFLSFSAGARGCIGRNISYLEQAVVVATLVRRYDFALAEGFKLERLETMNHILGKLPVKIWRRELPVM